MQDDHVLSRRAFLAATVAAAALSACSSDSDPAGGADSDETASGPTSEPAGSEPTEPEPTEPEPSATPEPEQRDPRLDAALNNDLFPLGIASGDPTADSVILWTKLTTPGTLGWVIARNKQLRDEDIVMSGETMAIAELANSVHVDVRGLEPNTQYFYKFLTDDGTSEVGRTQTTVESDSLESVRFAFSSCQNWEQGFYAAHRHLAERDDIDLFFWLGDYIYEYGPTEFPIESVDQEVRIHDSAEVQTLDDYRARYALYRSDLDLQAHHAARPWIVTWDDHEVDNDHAADISENNDDPTAFALRRADAYQAWYEHMPVRLDPPDGSDYEIYRKAQWGQLINWYVLDGRQYRSDQPTDGEFIAIPGVAEDESAPVRRLGDDALDPTRTMLGEAQQDWLIGSVAESTSVWNVLAQQVFMSGVSAFPGLDPPLTFTDLWDGYTGNRAELLAALTGGSAPNLATNLIVLTGDFHAGAVGDIRVDPFDQSLPVVATEFMASSISSRFPDIDPGLLDVLLQLNPQVKFFDTRKGFTVCDVDTGRWVSRYFGLDDPLRRDASVSEIAAFEVRSGTPGANSLDA